MIVALLFGWMEAHAAPKPAPTAETLYEQGLRQMRRGYYTKALESFNRVRNYHRDDPLSVKAQLAIADLHFKKGDFEQAKFAYEEFASLHPRHENLDYVTFRIGHSIYKRAAKFSGRDQSATRQAVNVWTGFDARFPESAYVDDVTKLLERGRERLASKEMYIAKFYARRDAWGSVRGRTEYLLRRYPDTDKAETAMKYLGTALHEWGATQEALAVRDRLATEFPGSPALDSLDRILAKPAGSPPDEKIFVRPYRIRGIQMPGAAGGGGAPPQ
jgi:outer membrane protein assembly factor BamD